MQACEQKLNQIVKCVLLSGPNNDMQQVKHKDDLQEKHWVQTHQPGQGQRGTVGLAHKESPQNNLVEGSIRTTRQESVQLQHNKK